MWRGTSYLLIAAVVVLAAIVVAPWPPLAVRQRNVATPQEVVETPVQQTEAPILAVPPDSIAAMFGWRPPAGGRTPEATPKEDPTEATWMTYVGYVLKEGGIRYYVFKDHRSGQLHTLTVGQSSNGWTLKAVTPRGFALEFQGTEYIIDSSRTAR